ncbi:MULTISPECIES: hypothetical protein [unclassified Agrobacterium]|uniref:hypothetical protein n=1 Tax=unclassified Agrobacterium TaxID=2632611 RepID=UPI002446CAA8|nr:MULTISPECIES: hypothetical protein [unclassified Agrobacterium]MDH0614223.1 hypothetical protein [Agrobacterium sp. GD03872]MDH0695482.1 hypothetical protein [Agrobacterium sp. GD03871]MDH1058384.1 hypothetical protein [Agrobacterium sp. GD03992]MDH2209674.1 hypothetical protein [Agrobacterium sp. GD03643]MDH2219078.1 hypothetical protein [Agrobacterium sp. GD03638]
MKMAASRNSADCEEAGQIVLSMGGFVSSGKDRQQFHMGVSRGFWPGGRTFVIPRRLAQVFGGVAGIADRETAGRSAVTEW